MRNAGDRDQSNIEKMPKAFDKAEGGSPDSDSTWLPPLLGQEVERWRRHFGIPRIRPLSTFFETGDRVIIVTTEHLKRAFSVSND